MQKSFNKTTIFYLTCSFLFLILGLLGIFRLTERPTLPIAWTNQGNKIVISGFDDREEKNLEDLNKGDSLHEIDGIKITKIPVIEFILDFKNIGETIDVTFQRNNRTFQKNLTLIPFYNLEHIIILLLLGLMFWGIGVFVFLKKKDEKISRLFFWGTTILAFSIMTGWPGAPLGNSVIRHALPFSFLLIYPFFPSTLLHFFLIFPKEKSIIQKYRFIPKLFYFFSICFAAGLLGTHIQALINKSMVHYLGYFTIYSFFRIFLILVFIFSIGLLINSYRSAKTREELNQIRWILWGIVMGGTPFIFLWTIPFLLFNVQILPEIITNFFLLIVPVAFAFSILKYRALNIEIIISKSLVYSLVTGVIIVIYLSLVGLAGLFLQNVSQQTSNFLIILFTLIAAILFNPLKQKIQVFVDKTFYRIRYNYKQIISDYVQKLSEMTSKQEIADFLLQTIYSAIPIEKIVLLVKNSDFGDFKLIGSLSVMDKDKSSYFIPGRCDLIIDLERSKFPLVKKGASKLTETIDLPVENKFSKLKTDVIFPVFIKNNLMAVLLLGAKRSMKKYVQEDMDLFATISTETLLAFERLQFFEKMILEKTARKRSEEMNQLKSEFVSHVSHELRTPMTAIRWSVENLLEGIPEQPTEKIGDYLKGIRDSSLHLSRLIDNLLDISKIEAEKYPITPIKLNLGEILKITLASIKTIVNKKGIKIITKIPDDLHVLADRDSLQQILSNLIDNAVKYSRENSNISIKTKLTKNIQTDLDKSSVAVSVGDEGIGIPAEKQRTIFENFERVVDDNTASIKGLGLGLHIVKKLVELNQGQIWVESEVGKGSIFSFSLPIFS